jgi:hypothetical protein
MAAAWGVAGMRAQKLIIFLTSRDRSTETDNIFNISKLCMIYFCDTSSHRHKCHGQILSLDSCPPSSEHNTAKSINFNYVIAIFAYFKERKKDYNVKF